MKNNKEKNIKFIRGKWVVDFSVKKVNPKPGEYPFKRIQRAFDSKYKALAFLGQWRQKKLLEKLGIASNNDNPEISFKELCEKVLKVKENEVRPKTLASYKLCKEALCRTLGERRVSQISTEDLENYKAERLKEVSKVSVNRETTFAKLVFKKAQEWGYLEKNPLIAVKKFKEPVPSIRVLSDAEAARLIEAASSIKLSPDLVDIIKLLSLTGCRKNEILSLRYEWENWDKEKDLNSSVASLTKRIIFIPGSISKNHKDRIIPMSQAVYDILNKRRIMPAGKVFFVKDFRKSFRTAAERAKIKGLKVHWLRHTAISRMIESGIDVVTVAEVAGHSSIEITRRYCHPSDETKRRAVEN